MLYRRNGTYLRVLNVKNSKTGAIITDATVTATLRNWSPTPPCEEINNLVLAPIEGTPGGYEAAIAGTFFPPVLGDEYYLEITAVRGGVEPAFVRVPVVIRDRTSL